MYNAKEVGKNRYALFTSKRIEAVNRRISLEGRLRKAIENNELLAYYQPKVEIETDKIYGMEALVRWQLPGGNSYTLESTTHRHLR